MKKITKLGYCKLCGMKKALHEKDWKHNFV